MGREIRFEILAEGNKGGGEDITITNK